jgi:D-alanyl-D-alanine carboxypeptidase/D-alanyl-D-alanine-endopeptidase (penicillin-binding protein 4)
MRGLLGSLGLWGMALLIGCTEDASGVGGEDPAGGGGESASTGAGGEGAATGGGGSPDPEVPAVEDPFEPAPAPRTWSDEEVADLVAAVSGELDAIPGASHSAQIVGLDSGQLLFERSPDAPRKPASNTKLFTTALGLTLLGAEHRPSARVYREGGSATVVEGDLVLVLAHDPTTSTWFGDSSRQALDAAARALADQGLERVTGNALTLGESMYGGNSLGTISFAGERAETASAFLQALEAAGIVVDGTATNAAGFEPPAGATLMLELATAGQGSIAHAINVPSHNELADLWLHHLGFASSATSTYAAGFAAIEAELDALGVPHPGLLLNDGSGLSHDNRASARHVVDLFRAMSARPERDAYVDSMAVAGLRGTISNRMTGPDTAGRFFGKTGTLTGVIALSGVLFHRHDGQRYVASFLVNDVGDPSVARARLDDAVRALAEDRRGEGPLPAAPRLLSLQDDANGETAVASLEPVPGASGYLLWRSADGRVWRREDARLVTQTTHRTFCMDGALFARVTAIGDAGESAPSSVFATRCTDGGPKVLLVDGNERHAAQPVPENPLGFGHTFAVEHAEAIAAPLVTVSHALVEAGEVSLEDFDAVVWMSGRESVADESFSAAEQERLRAYVEAGGRLFASGAEIAYDLLGEGAQSDAAFAREVLGIEYVGDDAATSFLGAPVDGAERLARFSRLGTSEVAFADVLAPAAGSEACARYLAGTSGAACVRSASGRVVVLGVPLESIEDPILRGALVTAVVAPAGD